MEMPMISDRVFRMKRHISINIRVTYNVTELAAKYGNDVVSTSFFINNLMVDQSMRKKWSDESAE